ncbi:hypothetical protein JZ751_006902, partial [Albula glossodonta]
MPCSLPPPPPHPLLFLSLSLLVVHVPEEWFIIATFGLLSALTLCYMIIKATVSFSTNELRWICTMRTSPEGSSVSIARRAPSPQSGSFWGGVGLNSNGRQQTTYYCCRMSSGMHLNDDTRSVAAFLMSSTSTLPVYARYSLSTFSVSTIACRSTVTHKGRGYVRVGRAISASNTTAQLTAHGVKSKQQAFRLRNRP